MSIYKTAINKPITTILIFIGVIIIGLFSLQKLPIDLLPEMDVPYITVITTYQGANSSEVETNVTKALENVLNTVDGLKEIYSVSKDNISTVTLEFQWGTNLDECLNDVRSSVDMIYDFLPENCGRPTILKFNSSMIPIMQYAITADESYSGLDKILEEKLVNNINRVDGIGSVSLSGAPKRYVYVELDPNKLDAYHISIEMIGQAIAANNINLATGDIKIGKEQYQLSVKGEYIESDEIRYIPVLSTPDGKQVTVDDIGIVRDTIKDLTLDEKINGKDGVRLVIMKQSGANTVKISKNIKKIIEEVKPELPPDIKVQMIYDVSEDITGAISGLSKAILYALLFVVIVILFFLGRWRATLIIAVSIPISLIVSFIYLGLNGSSINIISLSSLTIAIGMVVDDAIVVLENITKHIERGSRPREAAIYATNEVWVSVIASTLVIAAVFIPLTMLGGMAGIMFKEMGWIVTITVTTSTLVAISLTPMLSSKLLKIDKNKSRNNNKSKKITYQNTVVKFLDKVDAWYSKLLYKCITHKLITIIILLVLFACSLIPIFTGKIGADFMPKTDASQLGIKVELQRGTRVEESIKTAREIEERILKIVPEVKLISTMTGSNDESGMNAYFSNTTNSKISIIVMTTKKHERDRSIFEIAEAIRKELHDMPKVVKYQVENKSGGGGGQSNTVDVKIFGYDFDKTNAVASTISEKLKEVKGARDITISREEDRAELQVIFDKQKLSRHGLNTVTASTYVRNRMKGFTAGFLKEDGKDYDIIVRLDNKYKQTISDIENLSLLSSQGKIIKLKEVAEIKEYWCPPNIERQRRERVVTVKITPSGSALSKIAKATQEIIANSDIPDGVSVIISGDYEKQQETFGDMLILLAMIIILVYIVMASQFESLSKPFIIMMSLPFAISGVVLALLITNTSLDMIGALGAILLVGIVVKNGIVLVDYINLMRDRGYPLNEAIAISGQSRLRPVLMTSFTTILGMLPMALSRSESAEMWVPMGIVVIGGLTVATIITLLIVPVFYALMSKSGERNKQEKIRKQYVFMDIPDEAVRDIKRDEISNKSMK